MVRIITVERNGKRSRKENKSIRQNKKVDEEEKLIFKEILNEMNKHFNNDDDYHTNQQLIGH